MKTGIDRDYWTFSPLARNDDLQAAQTAAAGVEQKEGRGVIRPGSIRHATLKVYGGATEELTATEAGLLATPGNDRVSGGARRTYDLRALGVIERGKRGFFITDKGLVALDTLDDGKDWKP